MTDEQTAQSVVEAAIERWAADEAFSDLGALDRLEQAILASLSPTPEPAEQTGDKELLRECIREAVDRLAHIGARLAATPSETVDFAGPEWDAISADALASSTKELPMKNDEQTAQSVVKRIICERIGLSEDMLCDLEREGVLDEISAAIIASLSPAPEPDEQTTQPSVVEAEMRAFARRYEDTRGLTREGAIRRVEKLHDALLDFASKVAALSPRPEPTEQTGDDELLRDCRAWVLDETDDRSWEAEQALLARIDARLAATPTEEPSADIKAIMLGAMERDFTRKEALATPTEGAGGLVAIVRRAVEAAARESHTPEAIMKSIGAALRSTDRKAVLAARYGSALEDIRMAAETDSDAWAIATRALAGETRPANCRQRLQEEGKAYPKSSCQSCGTLIRPNWRCPYE